MMSTFSAIGRLALAWFVLIRMHVDAEIIAPEADTITLPMASYKSEYEIRADIEPIEGDSPPLTSLQVVFEDQMIASNAMSAVSPGDLIDLAESRFRAAYICLDSQRLLCLGISTDNPPVWDPNNLVQLQVKRREKNEMKGLDFLKMRWELDLVKGHIRLSSSKTLCIAKMTRNNPRNVALRPCDTTSDDLVQWNIPFSSTNDDTDPLAMQLGVLTLRSAPNQCLTLMKCGFTGKNYCDPDITEPYIPDANSTGDMETDLLSGAHVKLTPCLPNAPNQVMQQIQNCSPGCSTILFENNACDDECRNAACAWDNGRCPPDSTKRPTRSPTQTPSKVPTTSFPTTSPTTPIPTESPTAMPTSLTPSRAPSTAPSAAPTASPSTIPTQSPTHSPSTRPTNKPSASPSGHPTKTPSQTPTTKPSSAPTVHPSTSPTLNISALAGTPTDTDTLSPPWWSWLILALLAFCLFSMITIVLCKRRRRKAKSGKGERSKDYPSNTPKSLEGEKHEVDIEMGLGGGSNEGAIVDPMVEIIERRSAPKPPVRPAPPPVPQSPAVVSFEEFIEDEESRKIRKDEEREARARKMAKRSVMNLLNAMNDLDEAFTAAEKEMDFPDEVVAVPMDEEPSIIQDESSVIVDDTHGDNPNRVSGSTPLKKRTPSKRKIARLEKAETDTLVMEVKSRKFDMAIAKVEKAIGMLERKIDHEQVKMYHDDDLASARSSAGGISTYGDLDTTVNSVDLTQQMRDLEAGVLMDSSYADPPN